jgi:hypothetical protein
VLEGNRFVREQTTHLPLIEAKMVHHFDHRFGDYADHPEGSENLILPDVPIERLKDPFYSPMPRSWIASAEVDERIKGRSKREWWLGWRDITKPQNERTLVASLMPRVAVGHTTPLMFSELTPRLVASLYSCLCSFPLDYAARQKVGGTHLTYAYLKQLPVLLPSVFEAESPWARGTTLCDWILPRILELTYVAWDLESFARDVGYDGTPFRWDEERRFHLRCELDAAFFHLYGLSLDDVEYVMDTFPIVRKNDEKAHGEYRTRRVILEFYDAMAKAMRTGKPYSTPVDPLPGTSGASHGTFSSDGAPKDYAEALCTGLLFTLIRRSGVAGISTGTLSRALLWLADSKHAEAWLEGDDLTDFERICDSDALLAGGATDSEAQKLLDALETATAITRDGKGMVRLRTGGTIPNWLPQTPTLAKLAVSMRRGLERAERGANDMPAVESIPTGKVKSA